MKSAAADVAAGTAVIALLLGASAWLFGVTLPQSVFVATVVMTIGAGNTIVSLHDTARMRERWPQRRGWTPDGARKNVMELSWSLRGRRRTVSSTAALRLRALARQRLAHHGIDLDDPAHAPAAERLLGTAAHQALTTTDEVRFAAFVRAVEALEQLDRPTTDPHLTTDPHATTDPHPMTDRTR